MQINERDFIENFSFSVAIKVISEASKQTLKHFLQVSVSKQKSYWLILARE